MSGFGLAGNTVVIGSISLFLYFVFFPMINKVAPTADSLSLQIWFLVAGILLIALGVGGKVIKLVLSR